MAKLYRTATGELGLRKRGEESLFPLPADAGDVIEFDEAANPWLMDALCGRNPDVLWQDIRIENGAIVIDKQPVAVNPPGPVKVTELDEALLYLRKFRENLQTAASLDELKIEDAKHPPLPTKETADAIDVAIEVIP